MAAKKKPIAPTVDNYELPAVTNEHAKAKEPEPAPVLPTVGTADVAKFISKNGGSPTVEQIDHAIQLFMANNNVEMFVSRIADLEMYASGDELTTINAIKETMK